MSPRAKFALMVVVIAVVHFPLTMVSFFAALAGELGHIAGWAKPLTPFWHVLGFPAWLLIGVGLPDGVLLAAAGANSLLWGVSIAALWRWLRSRAGGPS